jgi:hypothetical protein
MLRVEPDWKVLMPTFKGKFEELQHIVSFVRGRTRRGGCRE